EDLPEERAQDTVDLRATADQGEDPKPKHRQRGDQEHQHRSPRADDERAVVRDDERSIRGRPLGDLDLGRHRRTMAPGGSRGQWAFGQAVCCSWELERWAKTLRWIHGMNQRSSPIQPAFRHASINSDPRMTSSGFVPSTPARMKLAFRNTPPNAAIPVNRPTSSPNPTANSPSATRVANRPALGWTTFSRNQE